MKSFVLSSVICQGLKLATQRNRPSEGLGKKFWQESKISFDNDSFPSGHSTVVWSIAPILADQYQESNWIPPVSYGIATLTSLSRIYNDEHWASDVLAGAAIGYFSAKLVSTSTPLDISTIPLFTGLDFHISSKPGKSHRIAGFDTGNIIHPCKGSYCYVV